MLHLNARSLNQNLPKLTDFLNTLDLSFSVIGISETWLQNDGESSKNNDIYIQGYNLIHNCRQLKTKPEEVSVSLLTIILTINKDVIWIFFYHKNVESIIIEIERPKQSKSPHANLSVFNSKLNELLSIAAKEQKPCYHLEIIILIY